MTTPLVYLNGTLTPSNEATVSIADPGFLHGASAFTTMLARHGVVFRLDRHLARLAETLRLLSLHVDITTGELIKGLYRTLDANELADARCRITLTPGPPGGRPTVLMTTDPLPAYPDAWYEKGIAVIVTALKQIPGDPMFGYKTGCYLPRLLARQEAAAKGAEDALWFTTENYLAESCFSNVFLVKDGHVRTPSLDTPVLPGVVREATLDVCETLGLDASDETPLTVKDMLGADEMFLTSSTMGIRPVISVERHTVGEGKPGPVTQKIRQAYLELVEGDCAARDPHEG